MPATLKDNPYRKKCCFKIKFKGMRDWFIQELKGE